MRTIELALCGLLVAFFAPQWEFTSFDYSYYWKDGQLYGLCMPIRSLSRYVAMG